MYFVYSYTWYIYIYITWMCTDASLPSTLDGSWNTKNGSRWAISEQIRGQSTCFSSCVGDTTAIASSKCFSTWEPGAGDVENIAQFWEFWVQHGSTDGANHNILEGMAQLILDDGKSRMKAAVSLEENIENWVCLGLIPLKFPKCSYMCPQTNALPRRLIKIISPYAIHNSPVLVLSETQIDRSQPLGTTPKWWDHRWHDDSGSVSKPMESPVVHIKIAGIYGCSSH